jgi:hypothetical protein
MSSSIASMSISIRSVAFQLRPLVCVHGVLNGKGMQTEHVRDGLHLVLVGLVQTDPPERVLAVLLQFVHFRQRGGVRVFAREPLAIHIDTAVDHRPGDRHMYAHGFRADRLVFDSAQGGWLRAKGRHRGTSPL